MNKQVLESYYPPTSLVCHHPRAEGRGEMPRAWRKPTHIHRSARSWQPPLPLSDRHLMQAPPAHTFSPQTRTNQSNGCTAVVLHCLAHIIAPLSPLPNGDNANIRQVQHFTATRVFTTPKGRKFPLLWSIGQQFIDNYTVSTNEETSDVMRAEPASSAELKT